MEEFKVVSGWVTAGVHDEKSTPGYTLENGDEVAEWVRIGAPNDLPGSAYASINDWLDYGLGKCDKIRVYVKTDVGFGLLCWVCWVDDPDAESGSRLKFIYPDNDTAATAAEGSV